MESSWGSKRNVAKIQGCQMVSFQNPNLGKFWRALGRLENFYPFFRHLEYFTDIWNILQTFGIFMTIWYILCSFGTFLPVLVSCTKKNLATLAVILAQASRAPVASV
jgi:hypothetical protein